MAALAGIAILDAKNGAAEKAGAPFTCGEQSREGG